MYSPGVQLLGDFGNDVYCGCQTKPIYSKKNIFNSAQIRRIAIAMNTNSYIENPFWYLKFDLRQIRKLRGDQPIVEK